MERNTLHRLLRDMLLSRAFEERAAEEYSKGNIVGFLHLYPGEEAVGAGIINAAEPSDYIVSTYREHAHALMRGTPARKVMAELLGRASGMSGGMGGSMHLFDSKRRFMGGYAIVGESCPVALGIAYTPSVARVVRGTVLSLREREFIAASRVMGNSEGFTMARHILPNCIAPLTVLATSMFGYVLLAEIALSFLGLGVPPPAPTWGNMLAGSRPYIGQAVWLGIFPGLCISLTLLGINLLGDAVRDRLDPRMRGSR